MNYINYTANRKKAINSFKEILSLLPEKDEIDIYLYPGEIKTFEEEGLIMPDPKQGKISRFFGKQWVMADGSRPDTCIQERAPFPRLKPAKKPAL